MPEPHYARRGERAMTEKELLELAARAAGIDYYHQDSMGNLHEKKGGTWNPLTDDGDALRLAVKLRMRIHFGDDWGTPVVNANSYPVALKDDPYAATRRAIVRAAAEIGKTIGETK